MAFIIKDRVKEGTTSTGTGNVSLEGAIATFDTFQSYMANGDTTYYAIVHTSSGVDEWEVGLGTWNTGNTLTRTTVLAGSNGTSAEDFSAGVKDVFMTYPASKAVYTDANGDIDINSGTIDGTTIGATAAATGKFTTLETTGNADIGGYIDLEVLSAHPAHREGRVFYDSVHKTLNFYSDDTHVVHEIGIEEHQRVYNDTGSTILKGKPLYFSGNYTAGSIDVPTVGLADATDVNAYNAQGLAASDIPNNSYGYCIIAGQLDGFDTSGLTAGANFFVGLTPGAVQNSSPLYPNFPMCLGWVVNSDATDGTVLVNQQNHSVNSFRVRTSAHVGANLQVDGNLTVLGSTTSVSTADVTAGAPFYRANEGDAIGEGGTTFTGTGLDDAFFAGHFTGTTATTYYVKIDGVGTGTGGVDTFAWSIDNFATSVATGVDITGSEQLIHSADNISVTFSSTTGHTLNDQWNGTASPINVDSGFFTNYNTGTSGVGYTHTGFYYDASEGKWVLLSEYDPVPAGAIDLSDSSVSYAALKAGSFEGNLTGSVTGNVTGTATSATALATARNIGGVSFNGTANIDLPGVNTTGNQDTTGNAATATALATARNIALAGDVVGSANFDGTGNISITAAVQDDSHAHVISNVDGLQTALDGKTTTARTISAGSGLTGGGDLTANRTISHADTSTQASLTALTGAAVVSDIDVDTYGHVTGLATRNITLANLGYTGETNATGDQTASEIRSLVEAATDSNVFTDADHSKLNAIEASADVTDTANVVAALTAGTNVTIAANGTISSTDTNTVYTHPTHPGDDFSVDTGALTGATVVSDIDINVTTDSLGHVTDANGSVATRTLTLANLGYTGATNANYITNNNQLTNGAGYTTNVGDITGVTAGTNLTGGGSSGSVTLNVTASPSFTDVYVDDQIFSTGDTNTYMQFHASDQWRVVTGGAERLEVNNSQITSTEPIHAPSFHGDGSSLTGIASSMASLSDATVSSSDPAINSNPTSGVGHLWINSSSGEQYILTDATAGSNVWTNVGGGSGDVEPLVGTGGTVTTSGSYTIHTFTSSGTLTFSGTGTKSVEYLVVAGGGGGSDPGGGGAGGYRSSVSGESSGGNTSAESALTLGAGSYSVTVGGGGGGGPDNGSGSNGGNSSFSSITALGGGAGGQYNSDNASSGGSGGGGQYSGASGTSGQGFSGGSGYPGNASPYSGGGGGGASASGSNGSSGGGGNGGNGLYSSITGSSVVRAGGGGGQSWASGGTSGGLGGGGNGARGNPRNQVSSSGTANTGGGGGGGDAYIGGGSFSPRSGGSGIVIIRYLT